MKSVKKKNKQKSDIEKLHSQIAELKNIKINTPEVEIIEFSHEEGSDFKGIINYLTEKTGGNIIDNGTINLTSIYPTYNTHPKFLLYQTQSYHFKPNDIICYDFKNMKVKISSYTIKSSGNLVGHIKNWAIEISDDGESWTEIDKHTNDSTLNSPNKIATFKVTQNNFARFCRFRYIGDYWKQISGYTALSIRIDSIEFYGMLKLPKKI